MTLCSYSEILNLVAADKLFLFVTVTEIETTAVLNAAKPYKDQSDCLKIPYKKQTYYFATLGQYPIVLVQCGAMGAIGRDAAINTISEAIDAWQPDAVIMVGIAFGKDQNKQMIGDVIVSESVTTYEISRQSDNRVVYRAPISQAGAVLLNRFKHFKTCNQINVEYGLILSGEKLIDNDTFKQDLFAQYPQAIGGEMESFGLYSAASNHDISEWIIVKGICDWADGKKAENKTSNQTIAAQNAVSLCKSVFENDVFYDFPMNRKREDLVRVENLSSTKTRTKISIKIERCVVRDIKFPEYAILISLNISSHDRKIYFRQMKLTCNETLMSSLSYKVEYLFPNRKEDVMNFDYSDFSRALQNSEKRQVDQITLEKDDWNLFAIIGLVTGERLSDGFEDFNLNNWSLIVEYNDETITVPLKFKIHAKNTKKCVKYRFCNYGSYDEQMDVEGIFDK